MNLVRSIGFSKNDPRLQNLTEEFANIIEKLAKRYAQTTQLRQGRTFHKAATTLYGKMEIMHNSALPEHQFLKPGKQYSVIIRHANGVQDDDAAFDNRGATLRILNLTNEEDFQDSLLDLLLTTGSTFLSRHAKDFFNWMTCNNEERDEIANKNPQLAKAAWDMMRFAESYTELYYYSKVANNFIAVDGNEYLVRFRMIPKTMIPETGFVEKRDSILPPDFTRRAENDKRAKDFLHQDLYTRIEQGGINYILQIQIRQKKLNDLEVALDCSQIWPETEFAWLDVASIHLDKVVNNNLIDRLSFNPFNAPSDLSMPLSNSINENASLNHLRSIIYLLSASVRLGDPLPDIKKLITECEEEPRADLVNITEKRKNTICIIGAGPSGLIAAKELMKQGYNVIVLERNNTVGGKCRTVYFDGLPYNLGGHVCTSQYLELAKLINEYGIPQDLDSNPYHYDIETNKCIDLNVDLNTYRTQYEIYQQTRQQEFSNIAKPGLHHVAKVLSEPVEKWATTLGLNELKKRIANVYTSSGYGYIDNDNIPALYFAKLMEMLNLQTPLSLNWTINGGFQVLWNRIANELDIRCNRVVETVERKEASITVYTNKEVIECQKLVVACPFDKALSFLDASKEERSLFKKIKYNNYYTSICRVNNIPKNGFYFIQQHCQDSQYIGHSVAFLHRDVSANIYTFYSYGSEGMDSEDIIRFIKKDVAKMGGEFLETLHQERWQYFPHVDCHTSSNRFFQKMEELQGKNNTLYIGSLLNFELVECNIAYTKALIGNLFPGQRDIEKQFTPQPMHQKSPAQSINKALSSTANKKVEIVDYLKQLIASAQDIDKELVDENMEFFSMGLDSLKLADMMQVMMTKLNIVLNPSVFFEYYTINMLAPYLEEQISVAAKD